MKKTQEMIGLPIISVSDGMEVGKVKNIIINADKGAIDYIVVDSGIQILGARVIPTEYILGVGEYALTIENESAINDISKIPAAIDLLQKNIMVKGTKVLTKKGRLIGEIGDIYVDEEDGCRIIGLEYIADITQKRIRLIPRKNVITFGKNLVIVTDDVESNLLDDPMRLISDDAGFEDEKKNIVSFNEEIPTGKVYELFKTQEDVPGNPVSDADISEIVQDLKISPEEQANSNGGSVSQPSQNGKSAADLFEQRQRQYLNGRKATKTITGINGEIIVSEGEVINDRIIDAARESGKLIELVMNNRA